MPERTGSAGSPRRPRVVVIGGGFGGLEAARQLARAPVEVVLIDRRNHHLFQPLLYQVATAGLSPANIAYPIRSVLRGQRNVRVILAEVTDLDLAGKQVHFREDGEHTISYDHLVLAVGACTSYFGHPDWSPLAPGLKTLDEAIEIRRRVLLAFEQAEREEDPEARAALLSFVVVGGGPTGVEMAGALRELSRFVLARDFRRIDAESTRVILVEGGDRVLSTFSAELSRKAEDQLAELGVEVRTNTRVTGIDPEGVDIGDDRIIARTVLWTAGVRANPLCTALGAELDWSGRVIVEPDCSVPGHPEVFAIGDMAHFAHGTEQPLPGVSPVALQQGRYVARTIRGDLKGAARPPFVYFDKGSMATIGRSRAIAAMGKLELSGLTAWFAWLIVHLYFLIGFRNRLVVLFEWAWSYVTYQRGARLITGDRLLAGVPDGGGRQGAAPSGPGAHQQAGSKT